MRKANSNRPPDIQLDDSARRRGGSSALPMPYRASCPHGHPDAGDGRAHFLDAPEYLLFAPPNSQFSGLAAEQIRRLRARSPLATLGVGDSDS
jgi:hypothetical protein